jgi:hypothetical protein
MLVRRLVLVFSIVFCGSLALAAAAVAAGGGGLAPGQYTFTNVGATAFFGGKGGGPQPSFDIFVNRGLNSFQPEDNQGQDNEIVTKSTMIVLTAFDAKGAGGTGCFIIPDGDFVVAKNLQSASLHTTLTAQNQCPGPGQPVGGAPTVGPKAGGGGGGLQLPIAVNLTWKGAHVISTSRDHFTMSCLDHSVEGNNTLRDSLGGSASGSIGSTSGLSTLAADVTSQDGTLEVQGQIQPPCFGK